MCFFPTLFSIPSFLSPLFSPYILIRVFLFLINIYNATNINKAVFNLNSFSLLFIAVRFMYFTIRWSILGSTFLSKSLCIYNDIKKVIQYF